MLECDRVLVVEDEALLGLELCDHITQMGLVAEGPIRSGRLAIDAVRVSPPDLILMDIGLGAGFDGIETAHRIRAEVDLPIVFLTAYSDDRSIRRASEAGPCSYLLKPTSDAQLRATIPTVLRRHRSECLARAEARAREWSLREAAMRDPLTQAWNRRGILELLESEVARAGRDQGSVTVLMIDIDRFKEINDRHGHLVGDSVLREIAQRMTRATRAYDALGRYGGDEFLLVTSEGRADHAARLADRLECAVAHEPIATGDKSFAVSISVGVSPASAGPDALGLLAGADRALYEAKAARRSSRKPPQGQVPATLLQRIEGEFSEMADLSLTTSQAQRLWGVSDAECRAVLDALIESRFLMRTRGGLFVRRRSQPS